MKMSELKAMMEEDSIIDETRLDSEAIKTSSLFTKYQMIYHTLMQNYIEETHKLDVIRTECYLYWTGKASDDEYAKRKKEIRVVKTESDIFIKSDERYIEQKKICEKLESTLKLVEDFMKSLSSRNFAIKNAIDYLKFQNGGY